ncbi:TlpA family protein disulfide reductase [Nitriliruptoraceae bacterium ZYF776]|nr:TlpA family protein disulfide reductase [Profundirhabdus halotolerans]
MRRVPALLAVLAMLLTACSGGEDGFACEERLPGVRSGLCPIPEDRREPAPDQAVPVLDGDGDERSLADLRGELVVVNFWASWCGPCRTEQPDLNDASEQLAGQGVTFLGVNIDDSETGARGHLREFDVPYPSLFDPTNAYAARFGGIGPRTIPSTILIDPEGRVAARIFGLTTATEITVLADHILRGDDAEVSATDGARR